MTDRNWVDLGLSQDDEKFVIEAGRLYQAMHVETIDTIFKCARAIEMIRKANYGHGSQGAYASALIQYGFTTRDGNHEIDKGIRANYKTLLEHEQDVRKWWDKVDERKKRDWMSARAIHRAWKASKKPVDPNTPKKATPLELEKATNITLQEALHTANEKLRMADGGSHFDLAGSNPEHVAHSIRDAWKATPSRIEALIRLLKADLKELKALHKTARPKGTKAAKRNALAGS